MQEININLLNVQLRNQITDVFKRHFNVARMIFSTTPIQSPTSWKPGGTMLAVVGSLAHSVTEHHADHLGRWSKVIINGNNNKRLIVYNVYNVVSSSIETAGHHTIFYQQWCLLRLAGKKNPNPKRQCIDDLIRDVQHHSTQSDDHICILGDFNEQLGSPSAMMNDLCTQTNLIDAFTYTNHIIPNIPTIKTRTNPL